MYIMIRSKVKTFVESRIFQTKHHDTSVSPKSIFPGQTIDPFTFTDGESVPRVWYVGPLDFVGQTKIKASVYEKKLVR